MIKGEVMDASLVVAIGYFNSNNDNFEIWSLELLPQVKEVDS